MNDSRNKILIVDDSRSITLFIRENLEEYYNVREVHSAKEALGVMAEFMPDLILLDIMMPGMDGFTFCNRINMPG